MIRRDSDIESRRTSYRLSMQRITAVAGPRALVTAGNSNFNRRKRWHFKHLSYKK
jgi:hypothetical protein